MRCCARLRTIPTRACCVPRCAWYVANLPAHGADCAQLTVSAGSGVTLGFACLAEALAGEGSLERALALLESAPAQPADADSLAHAYLLATRAELRERSRDLNGAILDYCRSTETRTAR